MEKLTIPTTSPFTFRTGLPLEQTVSEGIISNVLLIPPLDTILQISAPIYAGSSGSPVLNMKGEVVGIVSFSISGGQNLNFAIPTGYILNLVPMETPKTISDWTEQKMFRLYIDTEPEGARVRILNIKPKFFQGIPLEPGQYHIEVLSDGYKTKNMWIRMEIGEDKILRVSLEKQPQLFSQNPDELLLISDTYVEKGEYEKAINILDQAIQINPNNAKTHFALGAAYLRSRDKSSALDQYKILKDLDKELANQLFNLIYE